MKQTPPLKPKHSTWQAYLFLLLLTANGLLGHVMLQTVKMHPEVLSLPPSQMQLRFATLDERAVASYWANLYIQTADIHLHTELKNLDYPRTIEWLKVAKTINPNSQYGLLLASRFFGELGVPEQRRLMLEFVYQSYLTHPETAWPWLAHATFVAQHSLHDLPLALKYAKTLREYATTSTPIWAKQMEVFVLEDLNELDAAKILLGNLLQSGQFQNPRDFFLMQQRLNGLEEAAKRRH